MKFACGDMIQYFKDNPQKLKERLLRDKKKSMGKMKKEAHLEEMYNKAFIEELEKVSGMSTLQKIWSPGTALARKNALEWAKFFRKKKANSTSIFRSKYQASASRGYNRGAQKSIDAIKRSGKNLDIAARSVMIGIPLVGGGTAAINSAARKKEKK